MKHLLSFAYVLGFSAIAAGPVSAEDWGSGYESSSGGLFGASSFDYGYLDGQYQFFTFDDDAIDDSSGFGAALSVPIVDTFYVKGALAWAGAETMDGEDVDFLDWTLGAGIGLPISSAFDFTIDGGLAHRQFEADVFDDPVDGYGYYIAPGVRLGLGEIVELNGGVRFLDVEDFDDFGLNLGALIHLTPNVSLSGSATFADDANSYGIGLRLGF